MPGIEVFRQRGGFHGFVDGLRRQTPEAPSAVTDLEDRMKNRLSLLEEHHKNAGLDRMFDRVLARLRAFPEPEGGYTEPHISERRMIRSKWLEELLNKQYPIPRSIMAQYGQVLTMAPVFSKRDKLNVVRYGVYVKTDVSSVDENGQPTFHEPSVRVVSSLARMNLKGRSVPDKVGLEKIIKDPINGLDFVNRFAIYTSVPELQRRLDDPNKSLEDPRSYGPGGVSGS